MLKVLMIVFLTMIFVGQVTAMPKKKQRESRLTPELARMIVEISRANNLDPFLLLCIAEHESNFNLTAKSHKNALGMMQFIPSTAMRFGVTDPFDPEDALGGACRFLLFLKEKFNGDLHLVLAGYNAGENAVERYGRKVPPFPETQKYVRAISAAYYRSVAIAEAVETGNYSVGSNKTLSTKEIRERLAEINNQFTRIGN